MSALAAAPAWAAGISVNSPTVDSALASDGNSAVGAAITPPRNPLVTTPAAYNGQPTATAPQDNTVTNTQTTSTTGGNAGRATGGNAGPSVVGDGSHGGSHGGIAYANGGNAESHSSLESVQSHQNSGRDSSWSGYGGDKKNGGGQGSFVVETTEPRGSGGIAPVTRRTRLPGLFELGAASRSTQLEAKERRGHETAKVSPLGGVPGHGSRLPDQNPFFSLLSGAGGGGAGLMLLLLAVLGASFALPSQRSKAFRTPAVKWRPLAYVPPIELPG